MKILKLRTRFPLMFFDSENASFKISTSLLHFQFKTHIQSVFVHRIGDKFLFLRWQIIRQLLWNRNRTIYLVYSVTKRAWFFCKLPKTTQINPSIPELLAREIEELVARTRQLFQEEQTLLKTTKNSKINYFSWWYINFNVLHALTMCCSEVFKF